MPMQKLAMRLNRSDHPRHNILPPGFRLEASPGTRGKFAQQLAIVVGLLEGVKVFVDHTPQIRHVRIAWLVERRQFGTGQSHEQHFTNRLFTPVGNSRLPRHDLFAASKRSRLRQFRIHSQLAARKHTSPITVPTNQLPRAIAKLFGRPRPTTSLPSSSPQEATEYQTSPTQLAEVDGPIQLLPVPDVETEPSALPVNRQTSEVILATAIEPSSGKTINDTND